MMAAILGLAVVFVVVDVLHGDTKPSWGAALLVLLVILSGCPSCSSSDYGLCDWCVVNYHGRADTDTDTGSDTGDSGDSE